MQTTVYIADTKALERVELFSALYTHMPRKRQQKINRLHFEKDKRLSLAAGTLLAYALQQEHISPFEPIAQGEQEKPYFPSLAQVHFNLSHSGAKAMCAISNFEIGCDIEQKRDEKVLNIAKHYFYQEEKQLIEDKEAIDEKIDMFFRLWSLKESFMKATGLGVGLSLDKFSVIPSKDGIKLFQSVNNEQYSFFEFDFDPEYSCACCIKSENASKPNLQIIELDSICLD